MTTYTVSIPFVGLSIPLPQLCKEIQMGVVAKSYTRKGFLIYEEMRKYLVIYEEALVMYV